MTDEQTLRQESAATQAASDPVEEIGSFDTPSPYKVFTTKAQYQQHFDKILGERLRGARKTAEKLERLEAMLASQPPAASNPATAVETLKKEVSALKEQDSDLYRGMEPEALAADRKFLTLLANGLSVKEAYHALHPDALSRILSERAGKQIIGNILARGNRPDENAVANGVSGSFSPDVAAMNNDEIDALLERVRRGESISF